MGRGSDSLGCSSGERVLECLNHTQRCAGSIPGSEVCAQWSLLVVLVENPVWRINRVGCVQSACLDLHYLP